MFRDIFLRVLFTMSRPLNLVLATHNLHKQEELNFLLSSLNIKVLTLDMFTEIGDIEETGLTLLENSLIKARTVNKITGFPALADDTGLEVDILGGRPGVYSARYAGINATYEDNVNKLLKELNSIPVLERSAKFRTVVSFVYGDKELHSEGIVKGVITGEPYGVGGFGYDSIFKPEFFDKTFAEMDKKKKNQISHRANALANMKKLLKHYYGKGESID